MMNTYKDIFTAIAATGFVSLALYTWSELREKKQAGIIEFAWLASLIIFLSTTGIGAMSFVSLLGQDTKAMSQEMQEDISAQYDFSGLSQLGPLMEDAGQGNDSIIGYTGTDILGSIF